MSKSDDFFDFNHDGKLDALEWSAKMEFLDGVRLGGCRERRWIRRGVCVV